MMDYLKAFELLLDKAQISEGQALTCFLASLKHELEMMVRMFNLKTLREGYSLAKLQESVKNGPIGNNSGAKVSYSKLLGGSMESPMSMPNSLITGSGSMVNNKESQQTVVVKRPLNLIPKQIEEKRKKIIIFGCVSRLKKLMILIGTSIHCLCVMICLQVWPLGIIFSLEDKGSREGRIVMKKCDGWFDNEAGSWMLLELVDD